MITGFDLKNAMNRSFGISQPQEFDNTSSSLVARAITRIRAGSAAMFSK